MDTEKVSIIIPTFNSASFVVEAIESALKQTVPAMQIIVVDDGSTDDTASILERYSGLITCIRQKNQGVAAARNAGLSLATGDWIAFLDADDAWHPRKLELQLAAAGRMPNLGMIGTDVFDYPIDTLPQISDPGTIAEVPLESLLVRNRFTTSSILLRRSIAQRAGEFDISLRGPEDYDYWLRVAELCDVANLKQPLTGYREVAGSLSRRAATMEMGVARILQKLDERKAWRGHNSLRRKSISYFHFSCAHLYGAAGQQAFAIRRMLKSLAWYPLPYSRSEAGATFARPKKLAVLLLRMLRLMSPEPALVSGGGA